MRVQLGGHPASRGSALGRARVRQPRALDVAEKRITAKQVPAELERLHTAITVTRAEMQALREKLQGALHKDVGEFIELHAMLLDDPELLHDLDQLIRSEKYAAGYALRVQRDKLAAVFEGMDDAYLKSRLDDLDHVIGRIHANLDHTLIDGRPGKHAAPKGVAGDILVADNIAPSELAQLQAQGVLAVVTAQGSALSHSAILARSLHLPLVVGAAQALGRINEGDTLIVDGDSGAIIVEPNGDDLHAYRERLREAARERRELARLRSKPTRTRDGFDVVLAANAESGEDIASAHELGAAGLGLFRTEFLFLQSAGLPSEEQQFHVYRNAVLGMAGRPVTFRTLDLGADKADHAGLAVANEENPALGVRGVRLTLAHGDVFDTQLRAIARASGYGPVRVLVPMVSRREELLAVKRRLKRAVAQVRARGHAASDRIQFGAMIEVPAAAFAVHGFIDLVDFLSIGTNDLVQYMLAADRNNEALGELYSPLHPGVLRLLFNVLETGWQARKPVAMCGEIAGDARFTRLLLALGLTEFSMHPSTLLEVRRAIRGADRSALLAESWRLMQCRDRAGIEKWLDSVP